MISARSSANRSFTLVEILTATAVLSVLFSIMFGILQQTSKGWQAANRRVEASQVARLALEQIASDLENAVAVSASNLPVPGSARGVSYGFGFVHAQRPNFRSDILATDSLPSGSVNISMPNDYIFVVVPYAPSLTMGTGDLCEVGYVPVYVATSAGYANVQGGRYVLLRHMPLAFSSGANVSVANAQPTNDFLSNPNWFLTPPLRDNQTPRNFFPIVDNLIAFNVEFIYTRTNNPGVLLATNAWGRPQTNGSWNNMPVGATNGLPLAADITLSIFDERAAERIQRIPGRGLLRALDMNEKEIVSQTPVDWASIPADVRSTLQESVLTLKRRVFFRNSPR